MPTSDFGRFSDPSLLIMTSLAGGEKHGYAMMEDIEDMTGIKLGPGTLYGAIMRLEARGFIECLKTEDRRKPYRLTAQGEKELKEQLDVLDAVTKKGLARLGAKA